MPIEGELEQKGIADLLLHEYNRHITLQLARSLTKNVIDVESSEEAIKIIFRHVSSVQELLSKKIITKEVLFKYVHCNQIPVNTNFTKAILINKIVDFWERGGVVVRNGNPNTSGPWTTEEFTHEPHLQQSSEVVQEAEYPINLFARKFSEWFFQNYNSSSLKVEDFWRDSHMALRIAATDCVEDQTCSSAEEIVEVLLGCKQKFNLFFNANLSPEGVQGRMDVHGLVIVLVCGTLHTKDDCVGVFEKSFGLMRDPFLGNNWKIKTIQSLLRSQEAAKEPLLSESNTLKASLALPAPTGEI